MQVHAEVALFGNPLIAAVREQLDYIHENSTYLINGSFGLTASIGDEPLQFRRRHGGLRDLDVDDPFGTTTPIQKEIINNSPLPLDTGGLKWLKANGPVLSLNFPHDPTIAIDLPNSYAEPVERTLLGARVRTLRPEVLFGLHTVRSYLRRQQREPLEMFKNWMIGQRTFDQSVLIPFEDIAAQIRTQHPEYIRLLQAKDIVGQLPAPLWRIVRALYHINRG